MSVTGGGRRPSGGPVGGAGTVLFKTSGGVKSRSWLRNRSDLNQPLAGTQSRRELCQRVVPPYR